MPCFKGYSFCLESLVPWPLVLFSSGNSFPPHASLASGLGVAFCLGWSFKVSPFLGGSLNLPHFVHSPFIKFFNYSIGMCPTTSHQGLRAHQLLHIKLDLNPAFCCCLLFLFSSVPETVLLICDATFSSHISLGLSLCFVFYATVPFILHKYRTLSIICLNTLQGNFTLVLVRIDEILLQ